MPRLGAAALATALLLGACTGPTATHRASPTAGRSASPAPTVDACAMPSAGPPDGDIAATVATALAFAPDGRLFYAERSGTVLVWQQGAAHVFAKAETVTAERDGSYSERGLLGLAVSPTFVQDRFVYAFYSDRDYAHQHVIRWRDCLGTGTQA